MDAKILKSIVTLPRMLCEVCVQAEQQVAAACNMHSSYFSDTKISLKIMKCFLLSLNIESVPEVWRLNWMSFYLFFLQLKT